MNPLEHVTLVLAMVSAKFADTLVTIYGLQLESVHESNPVGGVLYQQWGPVGLLVATIALCAAVIVATEGYRVWMVRREYPRPYTPVWAVYGLLASTWTIVAAYNVTVILEGTLANVLVLTGWWG